MNSSVARDFLRANRRSNTDLYPDDWKKLPIPDANAKAQAPIMELMDSILDAKRADPAADIAQLEREVDARVAELYGVDEALTRSARQRKQEADQDPNSIGKRQRVNAGRKQSLT